MTKPLNPMDKLLRRALASFRRLERMTASISSQGYLGSALIRSLASICPACLCART